MPKVCLTLIVKNESHIIERCLLAAKPHVDAWAIVDTGSTDDTPDKIRKVMADLPGQLKMSDWKGMAKSRNEALDLAREQGCDYILMLDADDVFEAPEGFSWPPMQDDCYELRIVMGNTSWKRPQVLRADKPWRYEGEAHEYLVGGVTRGTLDRPNAHDGGGPRIRAMPDGHRRKTEGRTKYDRIAKILEAEVEADPENPRNVFYLAQSYEDGGHTQKAIPMYLRRARLQGWEEERWFAQFKAGRLMRWAGYPIEEIEAVLVKAHEERPWRAEPLTELALGLRRAGLPQKALRYAATAMSLPYPSHERLFVEEDSYIWRGIDEWAMAMHKLGNDAAAVQAWERLLATKLDLVPEGEAQRMRSNIKMLAPKPFGEVHTRGTPLAPPVNADSRVTVALPTHRTDQALFDRAIDSILNQTHENLRCVVLADGTPLPELPSDPRVVGVELDENRGQFFAIELARRATEDPLLIIQDDDDESHPERISKLLSHMVETDADYVFTDIEKIPPGGEKGRGRRMQCLTHEPFSRDPTRLYHLGTHMGLFKTEALRKVGGYYGGIRLGYDTLIVGMMGALGRISYVPEVLYHQYQQIYSMTMSKATGMRTPQRNRDGKQLLRWWRKILGSSNPLECANALATRGRQKDHAALLHLSQHLSERLCQLDLS